MEKSVHKDSGEAVSDLAVSKGINIDVVDSLSLFSLVWRVRTSPVHFGHIDSIQEGGLYSRTYLYKVSAHILDTNKGYNKPIQKTDTLNLPSLY